MYMYMYYTKGRVSVCVCVYVCMCVCASVRVLVCNIDDLYHTKELRTLATLTSFTPICVEENFFLLTLFSCTKAELSLRGQNKCDHLDWPTCICRCKIPVAVEYLGFERGDRAGKRIYYVVCPLSVYIHCTPS